MASKSKTFTDKEIAQDVLSAIFFIAGSVVFALYLATLHV